MKIGRTRTVTVLGLDALVVDVEAAVTEGLPKVTITGHADATVTEGKERVLAALATCGTSAPPPRITLNLSPAGLRKTGTGLDLAMAVAVLVAAGHLPASVRDVVHLGELGLDGRVVPVRGILPAVRAAAAAGVERIVVPGRNLVEARLVPGPRVIAVNHLRELVALHRGEDAPADLCVDAPTSVIEPPRVPDLADVVGQDQARFALEVAAAGGHHLFLLGPPGAGKTMLAERLPGLLPPLTAAEALEVTSVASVMGKLSAAGELVRRPPFESVHQGISIPALVGGGTGYPRPGALSAAHHGVLFIDEAPQLGFAALNSLRQPLESGVIDVRRGRESATFPARFQLVAAANPCPCGQATGKGLACTCSSKARRDYIGRLSGPLLDRIDIQLSVPAVSSARLLGPPGESTAVVAARVARARAAQARRLESLDHVPRPINAQVPGAVLRTGELALPDAVVAPLERSLHQGRLTLRGFDRTLRLAWTVADLAGRERPTVDDVATALTLRTSLEQVAA